MRTSMSSALCHQGPSIMYIRSTFVIWIPSLPVRAHTLLAYTPLTPSSTSVLMLVF